jgi:hypothetical protein
MKFLFPVAVSLVFILMVMIVGCTLLRFLPAEQIALQSMARKAGFIFGKQHPEMIPQARLIALGIEASEDEDVKKNFNLAVEALLKHFPNTILKRQIDVVLIEIAKTNADLIPIVEAFIEGMEKSL